LSLSKTIVAERAAVASEQPLASLAGYDVLREGGNAFDAAVATSLALAVTFHPAGGPGGDFFGMFYEAKTGKVHCLNSSGWAPSGLTSELVTSRPGGSIPLFGPLSCVVPGYFAGVWEMHKKFGTIEFKRLLGPSIRLAQDGFPAGSGLCRSVAGAFADLPREAKEIFAPGGKPPTPGGWIRQAALGKVISDVADSGPDAFYRGWPAERIASTLSSLGVPCSPRDFGDFRPEWVPPLSLDYRGTLVYETPPNSMGATSLLILKLLLESNLAVAGPLSADRITLTMKAALAAYARRDELLGDPRFGRIDLEAFMSGRGDPRPPTSRIRSGDTTAFSIADEDGNMVSGIQSLFHHFGSRVFVPECGIALNNRASGFSLAGPNKVEPRKRPLHTLSSVILSRGDRPYLAIGASGGDYRPLQHALFVTNSVDFGMPTDVLVAHPRFLWGGGRTLLVEQGYELPQDGAYDIQALPMPGRTGVCQAVEVAGRYRKAVCDIRGDGLPSGF
jgi:gamma-glutamyltranspeptidase / glutathione hydrolase